MKGYLNSKGGEASMLNRTAGFFDYNISGRKQSVP